MLVGEHTYGKGLIQRVFPLPDGGALKLTIGEYVRPNQARVQGGGLEPDLLCAASPAAAASPTEESDPCISMAASLALLSLNDSS